MVMILNYLPFTEDVAHHLNKLKFSSPSDALRQVRLKSAQWSRRTRKCEIFTTTTPTTDNEHILINLSRRIAKTEK